MKTTSKFFRSCAFICALVLMLPVFAACTTTTPPEGGNTPTDSSSGTSEESTSAPSNVDPLPLNEGKKGLFTIVRPDESGQGVFDLARNIASDLKNLTGATFEQNTDFISWNTKRDPDAYELILGFTNYDETAEVLKDLRYFDYGIVIKGKKIVIAAYTETSLKKAVTYFRNNILKLAVADDSGNYSLGFDNYIYTAGYQVKTLTVGGRPIKDYVIVYGSENKSGEQCAQAVADVFASATGYYLKTVSDKEEASECEILVGVTNRSDSDGSRQIANLHYKVSLSGTKLIIDAKGANSCENAARALYANCMSAGGDVSLTDGELCSGNTLKETEFPLTAGTDLRIITYNVLTEKWGGVNTYARAETFGAMLDVYKPDVVGVQEVCVEWRTHMPSFLGDYKLIGTVRKDGLESYSAIVYNAAKYDVIAQGCETYSYHASKECRNMSWAVLLDKTTGLQFAFISTHWDFGDEENKQEMRKVQAEEMTQKIKSLKSEYSCPVIITGDFNCSNISASYDYFMSINGMTNALTDSQYYYNSKGTTSIDFVMITKEDGTFVGYRKLLENGLETLSDHKANMADIDLIS